MLLKIYDLLYARYGDLNWWPANEVSAKQTRAAPYEVIVGAVLTQNTAWENVEKAIRNFNGDITPERVAETVIPELCDLIRPAGFFNQKVAYLKSVTAWFAKYGYDAEKARKVPLDELRAELLSVKGVGRETADSILLYALGLPSFVTDAYTARLLERIPVSVGSSYEKIKALFEESLPRDADLYNNYHALIVINGKNHCRKKPKCAGCPLFSVCERKLC
jgi:endonuclease-3 related protein